MQKQHIFFLFLFFALISGGLQAQTVTIPDLNFKNKLIALGIDTNLDGNIQNSEAAAVTILNVTSGTISNLTGIEAFVNLDSLNCSSNSLTSLDVSALTNLKKLVCRNNSLATLTMGALTSLHYLDMLNNHITSLDASVFPALDTLIVETNDLTSLNVSGLLSLKYLDCVYNSLSNLDVSTCPSLVALYCSTNPITTLDVSALTNLKELGCEATSINNLDVSSLANLQRLACGGNPLTTLNLSGCTSLDYLSCNNNLLTSLDVSTLVGLGYCKCDFNQIDSLDVSGLPNLYGLYCNNNSLTYLNVNNAPLLVQLECSFNQFASLDVSPLSGLQVLYCHDNPFTSLYLKNGINEPNLDFSNCANLQFICADAGQVSVVQQQAIQYGMTSVTVNSFCTFAPGGNYNTVSGKSTFDGDMNGCTSNDSAFSFLKIAVSDGTNTSYNYSNGGGVHTTFLDTGTFTFTPTFTNPSYFNVSPTVANIHFSNNNNNVQTQDFCITSNGVFPDVEIILIPLIAPNPGFDATYKLLYHNKGTNIAAGNLTFNFMGNKMNFVSATVLPSTQTSNQLIWSYSNLQPMQWRSILITTHLLPPPTNNIGNMLDFSASIALINDMNLGDNTVEISQEVIGSFDPNDKTCLEGHLLNNAKIGDYLHYLIRFQNTGTAAAQNVVVEDFLNATYYNMESLEIIETSHTASIKTKNNLLQFYFENIQLADSFSNEPESHGYVFFKIKTNANLPLNSTIKNKAYIYFDFNLPVITNNETTVFSNGVGIDAELQKAAFQCFPNPAHNQLNITTSRPIAIEIVNVLGESLISKQVQDTQIIDIATLPTGMYWIKEKNTGLGQVFIKE